MFLCGGECLIAEGCDLGERERTTLRRQRSEPVRQVVDRVHQLGSCLRQLASCVGDAPSDVQVSTEDGKPRRPSRETAVGAARRLVEPVRRLVERVGRLVELAELHRATPLLHRPTPRGQVVADPEGGYRGESERHDHDDADDPGRDEDAKHPTTDPLSTPTRLHRDVVADGCDLGGRHRLRGGRVSPHQATRSANPWHRPFVQGRQTNGLAEPRC